MIDWWDEIDKYHGDMDETEVLWLNFQLQLAERLYEGHRLDITYSPAESLIDEIITNIMMSRYLITKIFSLLDHANVRL